ncbi:fatty acid synthase-like protein, partial [Dinothrombium tinctorium]
MNFSEDDIVVSGISGRFPNADNIEELWNLLLSGQNLASPETLWPTG